MTPLLVAATTWWTTSQITAVDVAVKQQTIKIQELEERRRERESLQDYNMKVLAEVKQALERDDSVLQQVVIGLLASMPNREPAAVWLEAIQKSDQSSDQVKAIASGAQAAVAFDREQEQVTSGAFMTEFAAVENSRAPSGARVAGVGQSTTRLQRFRV